MEHALNFIDKCKTASFCHEANGRGPQFLRQMEHNLNFQANGRQPQMSRQMEYDLIIRHWKMNLIFRQMEHDLNFIDKCKKASIVHEAIGRGPQFLRQMEDNLNFQAYGRRPQMLRQMEYDLNV